MKGVRVVCVRSIGGRGEMVCGSVFERGGLFERVRLLRGGVERSDGSDMIEGGCIVVVFIDRSVFFGGVVGLWIGGV